MHAWFLKFGLLMSFCVGAFCVQADDRRLSLYVWDEYLPPEVIEAFEQEFDVKLEVFTFGSDYERDGHIVEILAERFDLILLDDTALEDYIESNLVTQLKPEWLPNLKFLVPNWYGEYSYAKPYVVPYAQGTYGLIYRRDRVHGPVDSWGQLFEPEAYLDGHLGLSLQPLEAVPSVDLYLHKAPTALTRETLAEIEAILRLLWPKLGSFTSDYTVLREDFGSGELWLTQGYSTDAAVLQKEYPEIEFVVPKEGGFYWFDSWGITAASDQQRLAHEFLNFLYRTEIAKKIQRHTRSKPFHSELVNDATAPLVDTKQTGSNLYLLRDPDIRGVRRINTLWHGLGTPTGAIQ